MYPSNSLLVVSNLQKINFDSLYILSHGSRDIRIIHSFVILSNIFKTAVKKKNARVPKKEKGEKKKKETGKKRRKKVSTYLRRTICVKNVVLLP